jgi:hypothetical protein
MTKHEQAERRNHEARRKLQEDYLELEGDYTLSEEETARELGVSINIVKRLERESDENIS